MSKPLATLPLVEPVRFGDTVTSGRTGPCTIFIEAEDGGEIELVLKLTDVADANPHSRLTEGIASLLGRDLGLPVPDGFAVEITDPWIDSLPPQRLEYAGRLRKNTGIQFASRKAGPGFVNYPVDRPIPLELRPQAMEALAFDALIQNADRRWNNTNLLVKGADLVLFDHDLAFPFLLGLLGGRHPWEEGGVGFLSKPDRHVFFDGLQGTPLEWSRLAGAVDALAIIRIEEYKYLLPKAWKVGSQMETLEKYLLDAKQSFPEILQRLKDLLK